MKQVDLFQNDDSMLFEPFKKSMPEKTQINIDNLIRKSNKEGVKHFSCSDSEFEDSFKMVRDANPIKIVDDSNDVHNGYLTGSNSFHDYEPWIQTYSGRRFNPLNPIPETIVIQDIAHALSMICRYNGHCNYFYSVAQHSVLVSYFCDEVDALWGLLHDASEGLGACDIPAPLKHAPEFRFYKEIENKIQQAVCTRFNLPIQEPPGVKRADKLLLATEAQSVLNRRKDWKLPVDPAPFMVSKLNPEEAKILFMNRFFDLINRPDIKAKYSSHLDKLSNVEIQTALNGKQ